MKEVWKLINKDYLVSNLGYVKSIKCPNGRPSTNKYEKRLKPQIGKTGYSRVFVGSYMSVHRLVAQAFIPNPNNKPCVDHIDHNKSNNNVNNLRWVTIEENNKHRYECGRANQWTIYGTKNKPLVVI